MKRKHVLFLILIFFACSLEAKEAKPKELPVVCLNMIVKNESAVIRRCLASIKPLIDYWVIVDTGSTDGTQKIIKNFMKDIPGELHERPWVNFSHNRNEALDLAKNKSQYVLFIDADDLMEISPGFVRPNLDKPGYKINIKYAGMSYSRVQLIKNGLDWKWIGVVHEVLVSSHLEDIDTLTGVNMVIIGGGDRSQDPKKYLKDAKLLENALKEDPSSTRYVFYLAQSYRDGGIPELAIKNYERRVDMGGWPEEVFWSLYEIGVIQASINKTEEEIVKSFTKAFCYHPHRAEPLYRLCHYFRKKENYLAGYLYAKHGLNLTEPQDALFVDSWIYDYGLMLEYSICAYWIGKYEESLSACDKLLANKNLPKCIRECAEKNRAFAVEMMPKSLSAM